MRTVFLLLAALLCGPACQAQEPAPAPLNPQLNHDTDADREERRRYYCHTWVQPVCGVEDGCVLPDRPETCDEFRGEGGSCVLHGGEHVSLRDLSTPECCREPNPGVWECVPWTHHWWGDWPVETPGPRELTIDECLAWELPDICHSDGCIMEKGNRQDVCSHHNASQESCAAMAPNAYRRHWDSREYRYESDWACCLPGDQPPLRCVGWEFGWWMSFDARERDDR